MTATTITEARAPTIVGTSTGAMPKSHRESSGASATLAARPSAAPVHIGRPELIGIANLLACRVVSAAAGVVDWEGLMLHVPPQGLRDGDHIMVSVRPEKLAITEPPVSTAAWNRLDGVVEVATFLGPVVRAEITVAGRAFFVDVPHGLAGAVVRKKRLTLGFAPADCVVVAPPPSGATTD